MKEIALSLVLLVASFSALAQESVRFETDLPEGRRPWLHERFDTESNRFTFAVFSDLQSDERPRVFDIAVAQLSLFRPELILNVGDLVPGPSEDAGELHDMWDSFDERARASRAPIFYVGGNHDLGNVNIGGGRRGGAVAHAVWAERYGPTYYSFVYKDVLFLVLNTQDGAPPPEEAQALASIQAETQKLIAEGAGLTDTPIYFTRLFRTGYISDDQTAYLLNAIAEHSDVRWTFLFMHKAPWENGGDENFFAIEAALADRPYTVFHGHEHSYEYLERNGRDYIRLATTGGGQPSSLRTSPITGVTTGRAMDQVALVTVDGSGVSIANVLMSGILDKRGRIPLDGDDVCFELSVCGEPE
jgi:hypothetical protein